MLEPVREVSLGDSVQSVGVTTGSRAGNCEERKVLTERRCPQYDRKNVAFITGLARDLFRWVTNTVPGRGPVLTTGQRRLQR